MGLFDSIANSVGNQVSAATGQTAAGGLAGNLAGALGGGLGGIDANLVGAVLEALGGGGGTGGVGGLGGLVQLLTQKGLGSIVQSWISTGSNQPVSPDQLTTALGPNVVGQIAAKAGLPEGEIGSLLSQALPHIVDKLTPSGQIPDHLRSGGDLTSMLGSLLG